VLGITAQREPAAVARTGLERHEAGGEFGGRNRYGGQILLAVSHAWARGPTAVQWPTVFATAWTSQQIRSHRLAVRVLAHIKKLDDCFGDFLVRVVMSAARVVRFSLKRSRV
jgi:hypothetical protein